MAFGPPPDGLDAEVDLAGVAARVDCSFQVNEWEIGLDERRIPLTDLLGCRVAASVRSPDRYALVLKIAEETLYVGMGYPPEHLVWLASAIQEAERTRARREGTAGREYLFDRVVPEAVRQLIER